MHPILPLLALTAGLAFPFSGRVLAGEALELPQLPTGDASCAQVEVNLDGDLLRFAGKIVESQDRDVARLVSRIEQVRVRVVALCDANRDEVRKIVRSFRQSLVDGGWQRIISSRSSGSDVALFTRTQGAEILRGLVVTVLDGEREAVLVHVDGEISAGQLAALGQQLNLDALRHLQLSAPKAAEPDNT